MKKLLMAAVASLALLSGAPAFAAGDTSSSPLSGVYVGIYGGYGWSSADTGVPGVNPSVDGAEGGFFAGYKLGRLMNSGTFTAAIEASYGWSNADDTSLGVTFEKDHEWGVSFRPGFEFSDHANISPYAILGYRNTQFTATTGGLSASDNFGGFELGLGSDLLVYKNLGLRLEYSHTWYGSEQGIDPDSDNLRAGVAYHF